MDTTQVLGACTLVLRAGLRLADFRKRQMQQWYINHRQSRLDQIDGNEHILKS